MSGVPEGWEVTTLGDCLLSVIGGGTPSRKNPEYFHGDIPWFTVKDMKSLKPNDAKEHISIKAISESATNLIHAHTLIIATRIALGKVIRPTVACTINQDLKALFTGAGVNPDFLLYWIIANAREIQEKGSGTTVSGIRLETLNGLSINLPPSAEQTRIVTKLEELLSDLDAGVAELKAAQKKLVQYQQSLLKAAVEGKLTQHWREQHSAPSPQPLSHQGRGALDVDGVNDAAANYRPHLSDQNATSQEHAPELSNPPPSTTLPSPLVGEGPGERGQEAFETGAQLLERILKQRRANWEARQLAKFQQQGKIPPKGWQDKYPEPVKPDTSELPELPEGWVWASIEQIASDEKYSLAIGPFGSNLKVPDYRDSGVPLVFVRNIRSGNYGGAYTKYVTPEKAFELNAHSIATGDVLVTKMGDPPGDADVYPAAQPLAIITADCIKIRCWKGLMSPFFLKSVINSHIGQRQIEPITQGVAQKKVSLGRFSSLAVPVPSREEQEEIMRIFDVTAHEADTQLIAIELSLKQSAAQRKNILKAAFSGQLVPQDPNDEPASVLLERIQAERRMLTVSKNSLGGKRKGLA